MNSALELSRLMLRVIATTLGSFGFVCLIASFAAPRAALYAILCLGAASAITLAVRTPE
jgi:hypothetical protein